VGFVIENIGFAQELTSPNPFALVSTRKPDDTTNLMALSWWTYASNHPPTIAVCISKKSYSHELMKKNQEFCLNIVDESLRESAFLCGTCTGRSENKPEKFDIALIDPKEIQTKLVKEHKVAFECRLVDTADTADHSIFIAEVVACHTNPEKNQLFALDGYRSLGTVNYNEENHL
jgi:flavin reductase (DIM6/NTAB) family NADH-FMN oxidoreductase RutF